MEVERPDGVEAGRHNCQGSNGGKDANVGAVDPTQDVTGHEKAGSHDVV